MTALSKFICGMALAGAFAASGLASAQTSASLAKPAAMASVSGKASAANSWKCTTRVVELAPVSYDTSGEVTAWVMVHRVKGEIIASERVSAREVEQIRRLPCAVDELEGGVPLVG